MNLEAMKAIRAMPLENPTSGEELQKAISMLHIALNFYPDNARLLRELGVLYYLTGDVQFAQYTLGLASNQMDPAGPLTELKMGDIYDAMGMHKAAIAAYKSSGYGPSRERAAANCLLLFESTKSPAWLHKALVAQPGNLYALYWLTRSESFDKETRYERMRNFTLKDIQPGDSRLRARLVQVIPDLVQDGVWDTDSTLHVISYWMWQGEYDLAESAIEALREQLGASTADFYVLQAARYRQDSDRLETLLQKMLTSAPSDPILFLEIGRDYEVLGQLDEAAKWFAKYYERVPEDLMGLAALGRVFEALGEEYTGRDQQIKRILDERAGVEGAVAELLNVDQSLLSLGPDLLEGDFETSDTISGREWGWSSMVGEGKWGDGLFIGDQDCFNAWKGDCSVRVDSFWTRPISEVQGTDGRCGYWSKAVTLEPEALYVFAVSYMTEAMQSDDVGLWLSSDPQVMYAYEHYLPQTDGLWRRFYVVGTNQTMRRADIAPLLRLWGEGIVWFDDASFQQIMLSTVLNEPVDKPRFLLR